MNSPFIQVTHGTHVNDFSFSTRQRTNCTLARQKPPACAHVAKQEPLGEGSARSNLLHLQGIVLLCTLLFFICKIPFQTSPKRTSNLRLFSGLVLQPGCTEYSCNWLRRNHEYQDRTCWDFSSCVISWN